MPRKPENPGTCAYCGETITKRGVDKHLAGCQKRLAAVQASSQPEENLWRLRVQDAFDKDFWLDLEMRGSASMTQLDKYLRAIWLECCGHLSEFTIGGWDGTKVGMARKADTTFGPGLVLRHLYDYGTTSETDVKVLGVSQGKPISKRPISLLARNLIPEAVCQECDQKAAYLCLECIWDAEKSGYLCEEHCEEHEHPEGPVALVNSPRLGMCGYDGPATPPY